MAKREIPKQRFPIHIYSNIDIHISLPSLSLINSTNIMFLYISISVSIVSGLYSGVDQNGEIVFQAGSGNYHFGLSGKQGTVICGWVIETEQLSIKCPSSSQVISLVNFASFGTPVINNSTSHVEGGPMVITRDSTRYLLSDLKTYSNHFNSCFFESKLRQIVLFLQ